MVLSLRELCLTIILKKLTADEEEQRSASAICFYTVNIEQMNPGFGLQLLESYGICTDPLIGLLPTPREKFPKYSYKYYYHLFDMHYPHNVYVRKCLSNIGINPPYPYDTTNMEPTLM